MDYNHEAVFCIVNSGFSEAVMDVATKAGAHGGTTLHARGTANPKSEKFYNIFIQPEKEIVMIITEKEKKDAILTALYNDAGLQTNSYGFFFSLPVSGVAGFSSQIKTKDAQNGETPSPAEQTSDGATAVDATASDGTTATPSAITNDEK